MSNLKHRGIVDLIVQLTGNESEIIIYGDTVDDLDFIEDSLEDNGFDSHIQYTTQPEHYKRMKVIKNDTRQMLRDAIHYSISLN